MTPSDPRVGEIQARLEAATPGPWEYDGHDVNQSYSLAVRTGEYTLERVGIIPGEYVRSNDAVFIANAPADVAYLLAQLRARDEALAKVEELHFMEYIEDGEHSRNRCMECLYEQEDRENCPTMAAVYAVMGGKS